jgi:plastocyanin
LKIRKYHVIFLVSLILIPFFLSDTAKASLVPDWVKNTAKWYGEDQISEAEFLNAIKYLIQSGIIILDAPKDEKITDDSMPSVAEIIIPSGNAMQSNEGLFRPLHLQIPTGTMVVWKNLDSVPHTVQSQDENGKPTGLFNSNVLKTGEDFSHMFEKKGSYNYYCTLHPWRVGQVTVT